MSSSKGALERVASLSMGAVPYKTFLSDLSETSPTLRTIESLSFGPGSNVDRSVVVSTFSRLLSTLRVPGPCDLLNEKSPLGLGAQFTVLKQNVNGLTDSKAPIPALNDSTEIVAIKKPNFVLNGQTKLDLSSPEVSRQVRNMIIEITALCHPKLRDHRNIVDLLGWGMSEETWQKIPFLALELANNTLAAFFRESRFVPVELRHHISLDIGCGLDAVHEVGLIHGDLKPENVLMFYKAGCWVAKLADFGGGADTGQGGIPEGRGTVGWRAPEFQQFSDSGKPLNRSLLDRIDSFSYGLILWSLFLKDCGSAPCTESVDAEMVALSELESDPRLLPPSLHSALKASLSLLLKQSSELRAPRVGQLMNDGSGVYSEWVLLQSSRSNSCSSDNVTDSSIEEKNIQYDWEVPEISMPNATAIRSAFSRKESLDADTIQALFMKYTGPEHRFHNEKDPTKDLVLDLLHAGAQKGSQPLRALIYVVHEHFQILPRADVAEAKLLWISEAVAGGAFFLRKTLQHLDSNLLETSIRKFHDRGGYYQFYTGLSREAVTDFIGQISLENVVNLNRKTSLNQRGDKLLHILSSVPASDGLETIIKLLDARELNTLNDYGETALYRACMAGATSNVLLLLSRGADPSIIPSHRGPTCLHWLFHLSPQDIDTIARELVKNGAQIHSISEQKIPMLHYPFTLPVGTPLHWAVEMSAAEATRSLLRQGANPSLRDGVDPYAYDDNARDLVMSLPGDLVRYSAAKGTTLGFSAIDVAVKNLDHEILNMLLSNGSSIDPNDTDERGYSALHRLDAGEWRYTVHGSAVWCPLFHGPTVVRAKSLSQTVAVLLQHGFELDKLTNPKKPRESGLGFSGQSALMIAVAKGNTEAVKVLLDAGADVNVANTVGETALLSFTDEYLFDETQQSKVVSLLLDAKANLHARDSCHNTPLIRAAFGLFKVAAALLNHGADLRDRTMDTTSQSFGVTAFARLARCPFQRVAAHDEWFMSQLNSHIVPLLAQTEGLELRNDVLEKADLDGGTLLHYTVQAGLVRSCATLIEAKVDINGLRRRKKLRRGGTVISYRTPLDEALKGAKYRQYRPLSQFPQQERAERMSVFSGIAKLLRSAGGVQSKDLIAKEFIPPQERLSTDQAKPQGPTKKRV